MKLLSRQPREPRRVHARWHLISSLSSFVIDSKIPRVEENAVFTLPSFLFNDRKPLTRAREVLWVLSLILRVTTMREFKASDCHGCIQTPEQKFVEIPVAGQDCF